MSLVTEMFQVTARAIHDNVALYSDQTSINVKAQHMECWLS